MRQRSNHSLCITCGASSAAVAVVLCLVSLVVPSMTQMICSGLAAALISLAVACGYFALRISQNDAQQARWCLERIAANRSEEPDSATDTNPQPLLSQDNPWSDTIQLVHEVLRDAKHRAEQAEHSKLALEVRGLRGSVEHEQIRAILDGLDEPVVAIDNFDQVVLANRSAEASLGMDWKNATDRSLSSLVQCEELLALLQETRRHNFQVQRQTEISLLSDPIAPQNFRAAAWSIPSGHLKADGKDKPEHGAVAVLREAQDRQDVQKRIAQFISSVSHEMKAPLSGIKAYVELLVDGDAEDEETREEFLEVINSQADRLQRLIENLLNLSRIEAGVVEVSKDPRSLNELLEEALGVIHPAADAKQIRLQSDLSPMYLGVLADHDMLLQAAINLLSNAIKYTPNGGEVTIRSRMVGPEIVFEVEDTGVGLAPEDCQRVFDKFYRVGKDKKMSEGTGLGLPLAKHIVEDVHGGRLEVESQPGAGSTFRIVLPGAAQLTTAGADAL